MLHIRLCHMTCCLFSQDTNDDVYLKRHKKYEESERKRKRYVRMVYMTQHFCHLFFFSLGGTYSELGH